MRLASLAAIVFGGTLAIAGPLFAEEPAPAPATAVQPLPSRRAILDFYLAECLPLGRVEKGFFSAVFGGEDPLVGKCLDDLEQLAATYVEESDAAEPLAAAAALYRYRKDSPREAATLARIVYLYPESGEREKAAAALKRLATAELKEEGRVLAVLADGPAAGLDREGRQLQLARELAGLQGKAFPALQRAECNRFLQRSPGVAAAEEALALREESYQREKRYEAYAAGLRSLVGLYPASAERPKRLFALGETLSRNLKQYDPSLAPYREIYTVYPAAPEALFAYERSAAILAEHLKKAPEAIALLKKIVELYPKTDSAREAFKFQAELLVKNKQPVEAVAAWQALADMFPASDHGVAALNAAAVLARDGVRDSELQLQLLERLIAEYAGREEAVQAKLERGQVFEEKLSRKEDALRAYQELIDTHAGHPAAEKARSRYDRLLKKS